MITLAIQKSFQKQQSKVIFAFSVSVKVIEKILQQVLRNKMYFYDIIHIFDQLWRRLKMFLEFSPYFKNSKLKNGT